LLGIRSSLSHISAAAIAVRIFGLTASPVREMT